MNENVQSPGFLEGIIFLLSPQAGYAEKMSGSKRDATACGVAGVVSWSIKGTDYRLNVMYSIPYDQASSDKSMLNL